MLQKTLHQNTLKNTFSNNNLIDEKAFMEQVLTEDSISIKQNTFSARLWQKYLDQEQIIVRISLNTVFSDKIVRFGISLLKCLIQIKILKKKQSANKLINEFYHVRRLLRVNRFLSNIIQLASKSQPRFKLLHFLFQDNVLFKLIQIINDLLDLSVFVTQITEKSFVNVHSIKKIVGNIYIIQCLYLFVTHLFKKSHNKKEYFLIALKYLLDLIVSLNHLFLYKINSICILLSGFISAVINLYLIWK